MTRRRFVLFLLALALSPTSTRAADTLPAQWIVVTAPAFRTAVEPLCAQRMAQGLHVEIVQTTDVLSARDILIGDAGKLRDRVHQLCRQAKGGNYVLLVGAIEPGKLAEPEKKVLPPLRGTVSRMKDQPSDNGYGCPGGGIMPTVAVGRFPARSEDEARQMVQKTLAYERTARSGAWRRQLTLLVGHPGGNSAFERSTAENFVVSACLSRVDRLHPSWTARAIFHCPQSRFCLPDDRLHDRMLDYLREGQAVTVFAGHSSAAGFWSDGARLLDRNDWASLKMPGGPGVFVSCGCFGCQLVGPDGEGYGLAAVRNPEGPVAVIGAHGESYAAMGQLAFDGLVEAFTTADLPEHLGDCWLKLKAGIAEAKIEPLMFNIFDQADGSRGKIPLAVQRPEHLEMWLLLGDPALRLPVLPADVRLEVAESPAPGKTITVRGTLPARLAGSAVRVTVERPFSGTPTDLEPLPKGPPDARARAMLARHERSNQVVLAAREVAPRDGRFECRFELPAKLPWPRLIVRAHAASDGQEGLGVLALTIPEP